MAIDVNAATGTIEHGEHNAFENVKATAEKSALQVDQHIENWNDPEIGGYLLGNYEDFAGFDASHRGDFNDTVNRYISDANAIIDGFNAKSEAMGQAFKGKIASSLQTFFFAIKDACKSYINAIEEEKTKVFEAEQNWLNASESLAGNITDDAAVVDQVVINN